MPFNAHLLPIKASIKSVKKPGLRGKVKVVSTKKCQQTYQTCGR
jgi:hypothetical protein